MVAGRATQAHSPKQPYLPYLYFTVSQTHYAGQAPFNDPVNSALWLRDAEGRPLNGTPASGGGPHLPSQGWGMEARLYDFANPATREYFLREVMRPFMEDPACTGIIADEVTWLLHNEHSMAWLARYEPAQTTLHFTFGSAVMMDFVKNWLHFAKRAGLAPYLVGTADAALMKFCAAERIPAAAINPRLDVWTYQVKKQVQGDVFEMKTQWEYFRHHNSDFLEMGLVKVPQTSCRAARKNNVSGAQRRDSRVRRWPSCGSCWALGSMCSSRISTWSGSTTAGSAG